MPAFTPLAQAISVLLLAGGVAGGVAAQQAFSPAWFAGKGAAQSSAGSNGVVTGGLPAGALPGPQQQSQAARERLQQSLDNLNTAAQAIAMQQRLQLSARDAARAQAASVPDGLGQGGLQVDGSVLTGGWNNALAPTQASADGKVVVTIEQTADKAILNWETFNVGRNTTVNFGQQADWAVLNRVNDPFARPSQIQGSINGAGSVFILNRNGVIFGGTSQVNVRNLVAAAATMSDAQFRERGLYNGNAASFGDAGGDVVVQAGALLQTAKPASSTTGGGYVMLLGKQVDNAGQIVTENGQAVLAGGDSFTIAKGYGTDGNATSTTRGNEVTAQGNGGASNHGLIQASTGDVSLVAHQVLQAGAIAATTSVDVRGTVHLTATGADGRVTLADGSRTAVLLADTDASALDSQRDGLLTPVVNTTEGDIVAGDALRRDQSLVQVRSSGDVDFGSGSLTLATGGQVAVDAAGRTLVRDGATIDVSGAVGVKVAMEANSVKVRIQGNEQRDSSVNREDGSLNSSDVWIDARDLVFVPAGTGGYATDRWYTAGGLLEVGGYLGTQGHGVGEWMASGGSVRFNGGEVVTQAGSRINLSGGTLDVQSGSLRQSWLKGADGKLYEVSSAPGDVRYTGLYQGFEDSSARWGVTDYYYNPLIAPRTRQENGYTVGRDAGTLVIGTRSAVLEGEVSGDTYQGARQNQAAQVGLDGYQQSQKAVARGAQLVVGRYTPYYDEGAGTLRYSLGSDANSARDVVIAEAIAPVAGTLDLDDALPADRLGTLFLDGDLLEGYGLGALHIATNGSIRAEADVAVGPAGEITFYAPNVEVDGTLASHGGQIQLGNVLTQVSSNLRVEDTTVLPTAGTASVTLGEGAVLDASGSWTNLLLDATDRGQLPFQDAGGVSVRSSGAVDLGGARIDVGAGGALLANAGFSGGAGGDLTLRAGDGSTTSGRLVLPATINAYGVDAAGTLDLLAGQVVIGGSGDAADDALLLDAAFFGLGFAQYQVTGRDGLRVANGSRIDVTRPVYRLGADARATATGADPARALEHWTSPLYLEDPVAGVLGQRAGASIHLQAGTERATAAQMASTQAVVESNAVLTVDPGQSITISSIGQLTVDGTLRAAGGEIALGAVDVGADVAIAANSAGHGRSIWLGENAVLDAAGTAATAVDLRGQAYGRVSDGGSIIVGGEIDPATGKAADAANLFVVVREGALLDASGSSADLDIAGVGRQHVTSDGGSISLASANGLYLDGELRAASGGGDAAGGRLDIALETPLYARTTASARVRQARELMVSQQHAASTALDDPAQAADLLVYGHATLGVDQVEAGGFDHLGLLSNGLLSFDGDVALALPQSLRLYSGALAAAAGSAADARVHLSAPYVLLAGVGAISASESQVRPTVRGGLTGVSVQAPVGELTVDASGLLDVRDAVAFGVRGGTAASEGLSAVVDRPGFDSVTLSSQGDLRLLASTGSAKDTVLNTRGDLDLLAAQIYPATGASASIYAGWRGSSGANSGFDPARTLVLGRTTDTLPATPYSAFGNLQLGAYTIEQGGVLRVPMGALYLGMKTNGNTQVVRLLDGSVTSVSADGLVMPYGGTTDGVTWSYDGAAVKLWGAGSVEAGGVVVSGSEVDVQSGAVVDLSGGGELTGAGFISGRGGSTDARYTPLMQVNADGFILPGLDTNPVYAIVPGYASGYAPAGGEAGAVDPAIGQRITVGAGVPGLPAGTYTLLPSSYALLPGAFRVEINGLGGQGAPTATTTMRNGSYAASGVLSQAGGRSDSLSSQLTVTPAAVLRTYSQYNETSYAQFAAADAAALGIPRAMIEADAKSLVLDMQDRKAGSQAASLRFEGSVLGDPDEDGHGSTFAVLGNNIEILADDSVPMRSGSVALYASDINRIDAGRIAIGALPRVTYGPGGNLMQLMGLTGLAAPPTRGITLRSGAELRAPEVLLASTASGSNAIEIEQGASIVTLGEGAPAYGADAGFIYQPGDVAAVSVSNAEQQWLPATRGSLRAPSPILIGTCGSGDCSGTTTLYSEGTIAFATDNNFQLDDSVRFGTRHLTLAVGAFNVGSAEALAAARADGALAPGLAMNQSVLDRLLRGDTSAGAPALETLELAAATSFNLFGNVSLSTYAADGRSLLDDFVLTTPGIYGQGEAGDVASIHTEHLVWNGAGGSPGAVVTGGAGTGSGRLDVQAERIDLGYGAYGRPDGISSLDRLALGFSQVALNASERISANNLGSLSVYQSRGDYTVGEGYAYSGGDLLINTPLLTAEAGAVTQVKAGGTLRLSAPEGAGADPAAIQALGGEWSLQAGGDLALDTVVALPSGKLTLQASGDVHLGQHAQVDLSGRSITFFDDEDATRYSWGGDLTLRSETGSILQAAGSVIDLSAEYNNAGLLSATALDADAGRVDLQGSVLGTSSGHYDAGGTWVPYREGGVDIRARVLGDGSDPSGQFAALNQRLNAGGVFGERSFQLREGDLRIGDGLRAHEINVSLDGGALTVAGTVDASGEQVGSIRLFAHNGLALESGARLDAHGSALRVDSDGQVIDSPNRAIVQLSAGQGALALAPGAAIDLRHGTGGTRGDVARGRLELYAPRIGSDGGSDDADAATHGDLAVSAPGALDIQGASSIALYANQRYDDARVGTDPLANGHAYQIIDQAYLDAKHLDSSAFMQAALGNGVLLGDKLAGLTDARYAGVFHLRPALEIVSASADGDLVVSGDLDLSGYRYGSLDPATAKTAVYGSGEPGVLTLRAGGDLAIYGSINDGFAPPPATPDDNGWVLTRGVQAYGGDVVVPGAGVVLDVGTVFPAGKTLNYAIAMRAATLPAGTQLPVDATLGSALALAAGTVLGGNVYDAAGHLLAAAGTVLAQPLSLPAGSRLGTGTVLASATAVTAMTWPAGAALPVEATLAQEVTLPVGALVPAMTDVRLPGDVLSVPLRSLAGGRMGRNWAVAEMLPEGSQSWSVRLTAGADLDAADPRLTRADGKGNLVLADTHYALYQQFEEIFVPGTPAQPGGAWYWDELGILFGYEPGTPVPSEWTEICLEAGFCLRVNYVWDELGILFGYDPGTPVPAEWEDICADPGWCVSLGDPIPGTPDQWIVGDATATLPTSQNFSVVRTGTGDLELGAAGDVAMQSLFGVYTAGSDTASRGGTQAEDFNRARGTAADGTYLGTGNSADAEVGEQYEALVNGGASSTYAAWYPDGGGNVRVQAGGDLTGDTLGTSMPTFTGDELRGQRSSANVGNWLWRQASGDTAGVDPIATSWWINFGTYVVGSAVSNESWGLSRAAKDNVAAIPELVGFTGIGTLGGGNLTLRVGGDAGLQTPRGNSTAIGRSPHSQGLNLAVASTGRVTAEGELLLSGGGDMDLRIDGQLNPGLQARARATSAGSVEGAQSYSQQNPDLNGAFTALRGAMQVQAGALGGIALTYYNGPNTGDRRETRAADAYTASLATATGGPVLMLGDAVANLSTLGDLVLSGTGDPGRVALPYSLSYTYQGVEQHDGGYGWFSLWTDHTAINLFSAGGDLTPSVQVGDLTLGSLVEARTGRNYSATDGRFLFPSQLSAVAPGGSLYLGVSALGPTGASSANSAYSLLLAPGTQGSLSLMAGDSIYAGGYAVSRSGTDSAATATPLHPAFAAVFTATGPSVTNVDVEGQVPSEVVFPLFTFGAATASANAATGADPTRLYARDGDILGLSSGEILSFTGGGRLGQTWYEGSGPVWMRAGRDIVRSGSLLGEDTTLQQLPNRLGSLAGTGAASGNLFVHRDANDVSIVEAGRDILFSTFNVAGPGTLEISAGGDIVMAGQVGVNTASGTQVYGESAINSIGPILPGDSRPGASIAVQAGAMASATDYAAFVDRYLDPGNLADAQLPLAEQDGKVVKLYAEELRQWLAGRYGFQGDAEQARAFYAALPAEQQRIFGREVYFAELRAGGREYNDADGPRFGSYLRGRNAIAVLFPGAADEATGGTLRAYGGAGIHTDFGGDIQVLTPHGGQLYGVEGQVPPASAGLITQGEGDIQLYAMDSILLGQSRIMTTFGGDILAWSARGDINAGRGSSTTLVYTPPRRVYDQWGNVRLAPTVPSTGAGIATLNPVPEVKPGDVDLIAPLGTVDAGEAGIRVSGNINIVALQVLNADNIQVQGESTGLPVIAGVNISALTAASAAADSAVQAAQDVVKRQTQQARPSVINVQVLGFGERTSSVERPRTPAGQQHAGGYDNHSAFQFLGSGTLSEEQAARLSETERQNLGRF